MSTDRIRVAVGLSGGVDSSVAAALLKKDGHDVIGITMEIFDGNVAVKESHKHACYGPSEKEDIEKASSVCRKLGIPFHVIDLRAEYRRCVLEYFRDEYLEGKTPNPCVVCNKKLKFGFLLEKARKAGIRFEAFATGHYAAIAEIGGRHLLKRALDRSKDQTYFLYTLTPEDLSRTLFPLGDVTKEQVREMARSIGLDTADDPESQDFIAGGDYAALFTKDEIKEGEIVDQNGDILGKHRGIVHYTIGQRRGLGIAASQPLYVVKIDAETNRIMVGDREKSFSKGLIATDLNLLTLVKLDRPYKVKAKIRLNHSETAATVFPLEGGKVKVLFEAPQMSVTPGQSAVFYTDDIVFGGGIIEKAL
jgi:tRNA-specific 2-thiouridylase